MISPDVYVAVGADVLVLGCLNATAAVGQRNVYVSCELRARPDVRQLYWIIDDNGTTVAETQVVDQYWTLLMVLSSSRSIGMGHGAQSPRAPEFQTNVLKIIFLLQ